MRHLLYVALGLAMLGSGARAFAQDNAPGGRCSNPDSIAVVGNQRVPDGDIRSTLGFSPGAPISARTVQDAVKALFGTGEFDDVQITCTPAKRTILVVTVKERPRVDQIRVTGAQQETEKQIRALIDITPERPLPPGAVAHAISRIDSVYLAMGYYLARITADTTTTAGKTTLTFRIEEGRRLAISGIEIIGNSALTDQQIEHAMQTKPEGFPFIRDGDFDEDKFAADIAERLPDLYAKLGYVDFQVVKDTVVVNRAQGKALLRITVSEGRQYHVGTFDVIGNRHFSTEEVNQYYPFGTTAGVTEQAENLLLARPTAPAGIFDRTKWDDATTKLRTAYNNEGYIYASIQPVTERVIGPDSTPRVNLRWQINEGNPATINRVEILGNDYTTEGCIRDAMVIIPGDVFSQDRLLRSYQNLANLSYFENPIPPPDTRPTGDSAGDVDLIFHVKEKHTGNVNFGASTGQGTGLGGFIGFDQPNLFGECKKGSVQWQFGRYINNFQISYTDPSIRQSTVSGTVTAYNSLSRYTIGNLGESRRIGASIQFGFPVGTSIYTRLFASYGLEAVKYSGDTTTLLGSESSTCQGCVRSGISLSLQHDTRIGLPFAAAGTLETITVDANGGPFGGAANYSRLIVEGRGYTTIATFGNKGLGSEPIALVLGLKARAGAVFGNDGPFFSTQSFTMGGTQYGEQLRGYKEFSIGPLGYIAGTGTYNATRASFGNAFLNTTSELGLRFNSSIYADMFYDAGNVYTSPAYFDPGRLFRGAGFGVAVVTPLGPMGIDIGYGFDKRTILGQPIPGWEVSFKLGQIF
jgi:outer membrane protein insertion porin family